MRGFFRVGGLLLAAGLAALAVMPPAPGAQAVDAFPGEKEAALRQAMRRLWGDHAIWMRDHINEAVARRGGSAMAASGRLMRVQDDIGEVFGAYFGAEEGRRLAALLRADVEIAVQVVDAAKRGQDERREAMGARWRDNAARLAGFLSGLNPYWAYEDTRELLLARNVTTARELMARVEKDWPADFAAFDQSLEAGRRIADVLTDGMVDRFPDRF